MCPNKAEVEFIEGLDGYKCIVRGRYEGDIIHNGRTWVYQSSFQRKIHNVNAWKITNKIAQLNRSRRGKVQG